MADDPKSPFDFDISKFFDFGKMFDMSKMMDLGRMAEFGKMGNLGNGMDFAKLFGNLGLPGVDMSKMFGNFNLPGVDMQSLISSQRRNIEALARANQLALEGMQAVFKRQAEIVRQSLEEGSLAGRELSGSGSPQEKVARQTEIAKEAFEKALANARELSEIVTKANGEAVDLLNKRFTAMLDEFKEAVAKGK